MRYKVRVLFRIKLPQAFGLDLADGRWFFNLQLRLRQQLLLVFRQPGGQLLVGHLCLQSGAAYGDAFHAARDASFHLPARQVVPARGPVGERLALRAPGPAPTSRRLGPGAVLGKPGRGHALLQRRQASRQALVEILGNGGQPQAHEDQVADL